MKNWTDAHETGTIIDSLKSMLGPLTRGKFPSSMVSTQRNPSQGPCFKANLIFTEVDAWDLFQIEGLHKQARSEELEPLAPLNRGNSGFFLSRERSSDNV